MKEIISTANSGNADSQTQLGDAYYNGNGLEQDYILAFEWYLRAAKQGHGEAQYNVAFAYANGEGTLKNMAEAIKWYEKSADQGIALAQYVLAKILIDGQHIAQGHLKGWNYFIKLQIRDWTLRNLTLEYAILKVGLLRQVPKWELSI